MTNVIAGIVIGVIYSGAFIFFFQRFVNCYARRDKQQLEHIKYLTEELRTSQQKSLKYLAVMLHVILISSWEDKEIKSSYIRQIKDIYGFDYSSRSIEEVIWMRDRLLDFNDWSLNEVTGYIEFVKEDNE